MNNLNIVRTGNVVGIVSIVFFLLCMGWGVVLVDPAPRELHLNILRITYPGFSMSFVGAIIGVVETFVYGWALGAVFAWLCNKMCVLGSKGTGQ